ncbi:uncharacterized protein LOC131665110 [Phymastichus coffea]|uniref:uncharacterized protein LOC131665110 n=1 Tax=Phymastichus coffea TaxID=108790 RepID=UPI00273AF875|nr:uncharacterized protein LOC131665110 [Phymastichus coffea]
MGKTRGVHETTPEIRNRMVGMYEAGLGLKDIAAAVNCSQRTVKRWLNRFDREGNVDTRERCGRKRATTHEQDEAIVRLATQTPITAAKAVLPALGLNCSVDTIRERLHKAGIHNWSPSRKHIQKIPIAATDGPGIQQAVWRPTGTQLGKKKPAREATRGRAGGGPRSKKRAAPRRAKPHKALEADGAPGAAAHRQQADFSFASGPPADDAQALLTAVPPDPGQFGRPADLQPQSQPAYHRQPPGIIGAPRTWPLDLGHGAHHHYAQSAMHHEQQAPVHVQAQASMHAHHHAQDRAQDRAQGPIPAQHCCDLPGQKLDDHRLGFAEEQPRREDVCSNSNASSNGNSRHSSGADDDASSDNNGRPDRSRKAASRSKTKKGGKVKGTLETSVEIRNRMIGMSEAGLSTLSIALAINRSERTVKRWLDRWHKEGNVQTKERKGRRRITTKEEDDAIVALATQQPLTAAKHVAPALGLKCSVDTIRERLHKAGIHSWKLGKKQGLGNAVHTVHLWQPSGNRSSKLKSSASKRRRASGRKGNPSAEDASKQPGKRTSDEAPPEIAPPATTAIHQEPSLQFQNQAQSPPMMQATHELATATSEFMQPRQHMHAPPMCPQATLAPQALQTVGPIMQPRSDCRLSLSALAPPIASQASANISYSSCMLGNSGHPTHAEQVDPMNYEPYIWSF